MGPGRQQELLDAEGVVGLVYYEHDIFLLHLHAGTLPPPPRERGGRQRGSKISSHQREAPISLRVRVTPEQPATDLLCLIDLLWIDQETADAVFASPIMMTPYESPWISFLEFEDYRLRVGIRSHL